MNKERDSGLRYQRAGFGILALPRICFVTLGRWLNEMKWKIIINEVRTFRKFSAVGGP